ncbi:MAG: AraC family transcriptional regulator [Ruminococcaceae bacterium]|nr:AraC family transcriptional regulator [Oscillospiraceae bacterium]
MDKSVFIWYNFYKKKGVNMHLYSGKLSGGKQTITDRFIYINDFGFCENQSNIPLYRQNGRADYQLFYVKHGSITIQEQGEERILTSGDICLYRPNEPQRYNIGKEPTTHYWVHFTGSEVENMLSFFNERSYHIGDFPEFELFCSSLWSGSKDEEEFSELSLDGTLITIIARIMKFVSQEKNKNNELSKLHKALRVMRSECHIRRSNDELASLCGISKFYFMKLFKKNLGVSPQEYYAKLIINKSSYLLVDTNYSISEIAKLCGIEDALYFSRMFKKRTGVSPFMYRKNSFL